MPDIRTHHNDRLRNLDGSRVGDPRPGDLVTYGSSGVTGLVLEGLGNNKTRVLWSDSPPSFLTELGIFAPYVPLQVTDMSGKAWEK